MSEIVRKPCPSCKEEDGKGDNLAVFPDGHAHCFACGYHIHGSGAEVSKAKRGEKLAKPIVGKVLALGHRHINDRTTRLYDYRMAKIDGQIVEVENFFKDGALIAQHLRRPGKKFSWIGDTENLPLFGQWLWGGKGKRIIVTEGAIDCMTISQLQNNRWPVVSVPNGSSHAPKAIRTNLEFLAGYDEIVLCFDNDAAGVEAAEKCAVLLPPGKVRIARTPRKDANEHLLANDTQVLMTAIYEARTYQPDGILSARDVTDGDRIPQKVWTFPWDCLTKKFMGQRSGEITLYASGAGSGKSTLMRELAMHHVEAGRRVGMIMLEEAPAETRDDMIALRLSKPVRQIRAMRELNAIMTRGGKKLLDFDIEDNLTDDEYAEAVKWWNEQPIFLYDHHGTNQYDQILNRVEYLAVGLECDIIIIDHVTAFVANVTRTGSEREDIDKTMYALRSMVERTGVHIDVVSQLNRLDGKAAEEGGQISLKNLRGSGSLASVPNSVIAIERNQQSEDPEERRIVKVRALKGRFTGDTAVAGHLKFNPETRRLEESEWTQPKENPFGDESEPDSGILEALDSE